MAEGLDRDSRMDWRAAREVSMRQLDADCAVELM